MIQNAPEPLSVNNDVPPPNEWRTSLRQNLNFPGTNSQFADTGSRIFLPCTILNRYMPTCESGNHLLDLDPGDKYRSAIQNNPTLGPHIMIDMNRLSYATGKPHPVTDQQVSHVHCEH